MPDWFGVGGGVIAIAIAMALCLGILILLRLVRQKRHGGRQDRQVEPSYGRLAVVESTAIDAQRSLVLVRCDNAEHLVMIGGPTDIVIENDVHGSRLRHRPVSASVQQAEADPARGALAAAPSREGPSTQRLAARDVKPLPPMPVVRPIIGPDTGRETPRGDAPQNQDSPAAAPRPTLSAVPAATEPAGAPGSGSASGKAVKESDAAASSVIAPAGQGRRQAGIELGRRRHDPPMRHNGAGGGAGGNAAGGAAANTASVGGPQQDQRGERQQTAGRPNRGDSAEPQFGKREGGGQGRRAQLQAAQIGPRRNEETPRVQQLPQRDPGGIAEHRMNGPQGPAPVPTISAPVMPPPLMPKAEAPWPEPDSIEGAIVDALAADPQPRAEAAPLRNAEGSSQGAARQEPAPPKIPTGAATTLGDLAERLEEALAREVRSAKDRDQQDGLDFDLDQFNFDRERPGHEQHAQSDGSPASLPAQASAIPPAPPAAAQTIVATSSSTPETGPWRDIPPAPAPEAPRDQRLHDGHEERPQEAKEAPVINLSERRREPVDPLEDEMARLLGELAGEPSSRS